MPTFDDPIRMREGNRVTSKVEINYPAEMRFSGQLVESVRLGLSPWILISLSYSVRPGVSVGSKITIEVEAKFTHKNMSVREMTVSFRVSDLLQKLASVGTDDEGDFIYFQYPSPDHYCRANDLMNMMEQAGVFTAHENRV